MNTKLTKKNQSPLFSESASDYLEANGFRRSDSKHFPGQIVYFLKDSMAIEIRNDSVEVKSFHPADQEEGARWITDFKFNGISKLDDFGWMLLFHITDVVPLKVFLRGLIREGAFISKSDLMSSIFEHFKVTENHEAVPVGY